MKTIHICTAAHCVLKGAEEKFGLSQASLIENFMVSHALISLHIWLHFQKN